MIVERDNWLSRSLFAGLPIERLEMARFAALIKESRPALVIDVGANIGVYTLLACKHGNAQIYAFEPNSQVLNHLAANVLLNGWSSRVAIHPFALGADDGEADLFLSPQNAEVATFRPELMVGLFSYPQQARVKVAHFDRLYQPEGLDVLVKIDVEGFEDDVLHGMERLFARNRVTLLVEVFLKDSPVAARLQSWGYEETGRSGYNYWYARSQPSQ
jgi:FkbM family methyltransferase